MLVLFSMGITKGKWSTLLTELLEFKRHYDANIPLIEALPSVARSGAATYAGMGLRDLCDALHACYCENATARAMRRMYTALPEPAMTPAQAYDALVRGEVEAVPIDELEGRVAAVMLVPYPPGIPLIMPGERFTGETRSILDYLRFARTSPSASRASMRTSMACNTRSPPTAAHTPSIASARGDGRGFEALHRHERAVRRRGLYHIVCIGIHSGWYQLL